MNNKIVVALLFGLAATLVAAPVAANQSDPHAEEADGCDHGNTSKPCRDDPQPDHGQDCAVHGNHGGINEDHCALPTRTTTEPTTTTTEPPDVTTSPTEPAPPEVTGTATDTPATSEAVQRAQLVPPVTVEAPPITPAPTVLAHTGLSQTLAAVGLLALLAGSLLLLARRVIANRTEGDGQ